MMRQQSRDLRLLEPNTKLLTFPMHGQKKLLSEGYRTRDGHLIEWFGKLLKGEGSVAVLSRPEPRILPKKHQFDTRKIAANTYPVSFHSSSIPNPFNRRNWWVKSVNGYGALPEASQAVPSVVWNPFTAIARPASNPFNGTRKTVLDLLDDWSIHFAFEGIKRDVERAYGEAFDKADYVTANAEGTAKLAERFGRSDVVLLPNGVDADRFIPASKATGPIRIGYLGKIGRRVDLDLVLDCADSCPSIDFVFAGPILDKEYKAPLASRKNITLLGDVHYENVPDLLSSFDVGWVPHRVGEGEVGGDVMKTYEYRAAHLPVLTTPVEGANKRGLTHVHVLGAAFHKSWILKTTYGMERIQRQQGELPLDTLWETKARRILHLLNLEPETAAQ